MFGSLKINGVKVVDKVLLNDAKPGFLVISGIGSNCTWNVGDLLFKSVSTANNLNPGSFSVVNLTKSQSWVSDGTSKYEVSYVDVDLNYQKVEK